MGRHNTGRFPQVGIFRKGENRAPDTIDKSRHHRHVGLTGQHFKSALDGHQLTSARNMTFRKNCDDLPGFQGADRQPDALRCATTSDSDRSAATESPIEKPVRPQSLVTHEPDGARASQLQQYRIHIGKMIGNNQYPTRGGNVRNARSPDAIKSPGYGRRTNLKITRQKGSLGVKQRKHETTPCRQ